MPTLELFADDAYLAQTDATVVEVRADGIVLDRTVFYPEGGGQVGDTGSVGELRIRDTQRDGDAIVHLGEGPPTLEVGQALNAAIDWPRRYTVMRHHTLLHLCYLATLDVLGEPVNVIGSQVREEKARLDYDFHGELDRTALAEAVEALIAADLEVTTEPVGDDGRTRQWRIPGYEPIPCGGTHVRRTSELGQVKIKVQRKGSQGTRVYCNVTSDAS